MVLAPVSQCPSVGWYGLVVSYGLLALTMAPIHPLCAFLDLLNLLSAVPSAGLVFSPVLICELLPPSSLLSFMEAWETSGLHCSCVLLWRPLPQPTKVSQGCHSAAPASLSSPAYGL